MLTVGDIITNIIDDDRKFILKAVPIPNNNNEEIYLDPFHTPYWKLIVRAYYFIERKVEIIVDKEDINKWEIK